MPDTPLIQQIRTASRLMVRELGFMSTTLAATHYSPSAVHTLLEVSMRGEMTAAQLVTLLGLEKSSVRNGELAWDESPVQSTSKAQLVLLLIRRIRNNLFHGGKFNGRWFEPERSELLMHHALIILKACAMNHAAVSEAYNCMDVSL